MHGYGVLCEMGPSVHFSALNIQLPTARDNKDHVQLKKKLVQPKPEFKNARKHVSLSVIMRNQSSQIRTNTIGV